MFVPKELVDLKKKFALLLCKLTISLSVLQSILTSAFHFLFLDLCDKLKYAGGQGTYIYTRFNTLNTCGLNTQYPFGLQILVQPHACTLRTFLSTTRCKRNLIQFMFMRVAINRVRSAAKAVLCFSHYYLQRDCCKNIGKAQHSYLSRFHLLSGTPHIAMFRIRALYSGLVQ